MKMSSISKIVASITGVLGLAAILAFNFRASTEPDNVTRIPTKLPPLSQSDNNGAKSIARPKQDKLASAIAVSQEFQTTRDLHGLYMRLKDSPDPDAKRFALRSLDFCARYVVRNGNQVSLSAAPEPLPEATPQQDLANRNLFAKCAGFRNTEGSEIWSEIRRLKAIVATEESAITYAENASILLSRNEHDKAAALARKVFQSKEPDAIAELEHYVQEIQDNRSKATGQSSEGNFDGLAIRLAACELGKDCSSGTLEMQALCLYGGSCNDSLPEKTAKVLPYAAMQEVLRRRDEFLAAIRSGNLHAIGY